MNTHNMNDLISRIKQSRMSVTAKNACDNFAILHIAVQDNNLREKYTTLVANHNANTLDRYYPDSGFDLVFPTDVTFDKAFVSKFVDFQVKTEMFYVNTATDTWSNCAFTTHPRSSISKTPLMLANHTGIIDSGYRGNLIGAFRWLNDDANTRSYNVVQHTRLLQACHPTLCPIYVVIVEDDQLSSSERGAGGFGSTGK
jgi:dUTPase